jgi:hypothetical protein
MKTLLTLLMLSTATVADSQPKKVVEPVSYTAYLYKTVGPDMAMPVLAVTASQADLAMGACQALARGQPDLFCHKDGSLDAFKQMPTKEAF